VFEALKPGFRSLATLKLVMNVVSELLTEKNSCGIVRFPYNNTTFLFYSGHCDTSRILTDVRDVTMHGAVSTQWRHISGLPFSQLLYVGGNPTI